MQWFCHPIDSRRLRADLAVGLVGLAILLSNPTHAETNLSGKVLDSITGRPVDGVQVQVRQGQSVLASGVTTSDGVFQLLVNLPLQPTPITLNVALTREGFGTANQQVGVTAGRADQLSYAWVLPRQEAAGCAPTWARTVVVGFVRPPTSATAELALSRRIGEVLHYDLLPEVQKTHLATDQQPVILPCPKAEPRDLMEHAF